MKIAQSKGEAVFAKRVTRRALSFAPLLVGLSCSSLPSKSEEDAPISRRDLFAAPDHAEPRMSPDGSRIAFIAPLGSTDNLWVAPIGDPAAARPVTRWADGAGLTSYQWAYSNRHILLLRDPSGEEDFRLHVVDVDSGVDRDVSPARDAQVRIEALRASHPTNALIGVNDRDARFHDVYRLDLTTGERTLVWRNTSFVKVLADDQLELRIGQEIRDDGSIRVHFKKDAAHDFTTALDIPFEDTLTTKVLRLQGDGTLVLADSAGRDKAALIAYDLTTHERRVLAEDTHADIVDAVVNPRDGHLEAGVAQYERRRWHFLDPAFERSLHEVAEEEDNRDADLEILSRSDDDRSWLLASHVSHRPAHYWLFDRVTGERRMLFSGSSMLDRRGLATTHPVLLPSRDGLSLVSYVTLPRTRRDHRPGSPPPMVVLVHGGPWERDTWQFDRTDQWLADRGYVVLRVNFRGSTGFGKAFVNAGNREWGRTMQRDLVDAMKWAVDRGLADPTRVAIVGSSYGGYAALAGLAFTPELFACGVDVVGPSNLVTLLASIPAYYQPEIEQNTRRIGDHRTAEGRKLLEERSPLKHVRAVRAPLLVGHGANDQRIKRSHSDDLVKAMSAASLPVTYVLYPDEGHSFLRPQNQLSWNAVVESFLAECLGGYAEPFDPTERGSMIVLHGQERIPALRSVHSIEQARIAEVTSIAQMHEAP